MRSGSLCLPPLLSLLVACTSAGDAAHPVAPDEPGPSLMASGYAGPVDLGALPTGTWAVATAISESDLVVGMSEFASGTRAVSWSSAGILNLGTLPGHTTSGAADINRYAMIVGSSCSPCRPFIWNPASGMKALATPDPSLTYSAVAINDFGVIAGNTTASTGTTRAIKWSASGQPVDLHKPWWRFSKATDIRNDGRIVGMAGIYYQEGQLPGEYVNFAVWWDSTGKVTVLNEGGAAAISQNGWIVGSYPEGSGSGTFIYTPAGVYSKAGGHYRTLRDVNARGRAAGQDSLHAAIYQNGTWARLPEQDALYSSANAINDCGSAVGQARSPQGKERPIIWRVRACR